VAASSMWIDADERLPRRGALVWAVAAGIPGLWQVPVIARIRIPLLHVAGQWQDVRTGRRLDAGRAKVTHWRPLEAPDPPA
jgi:hypothetical protein